MLICLCGMFLRGWWSRGGLEAQLTSLLWTLCRLFWCNQTSDAAGWNWSPVGSYLNVTLCRAVALATAYQSYRCDGRRPISRMLVNCSILHRWRWKWFTVSSGRLCSDQSESLVVAIRWQRDADTPPSHRWALDRITIQITLNAFHLVVFFCGETSRD